METNLLNQPLSLPNGSVLRNRLAKAAMSETLGSCLQVIMRIEPTRLNPS